MAFNGTNYGGFGSTIAGVGIGAGNSHARSISAPSGVRAVIRSIIVALSSGSAPFAGETMATLIVIKSNNADVRTVDLTDIGALDVRINAKVSSLQNPLHLKFSDDELAPMPGETYHVIISDPRNAGGATAATCDLSVLGYYPVGSDLRVKLR